MRPPDQNSPASSADALPGGRAPDSARIRAYIDHAMSAAEEERFELDMFADPELAEAVHAQKLLRDGLQALEARGTTTATPALGKVVTLPPRPAPLQRWMPLAATFLLGALLGGLAMQWRTPSVPTGLHGRAQVVALKQLRDAAPGSDPVLLLPADTPNLILQFVQPAAEAVRDYRFELVPDTGAPLHLPGLRPGDDAIISIRLDAADMAPGRYVARLIQIDRNGAESTVLDQAFQLRRADRTG